MVKEFLFPCFFSFPISFSQFLWVFSVCVCVCVSDDDDDDDGEDEMITMREFPLYAVYVWLSVGESR